LTQDGLAARLAGKYALDYRTISKWERGERKPKREVVILLAEALELREEETSDLLNSAGYIDPKATRNK